MPEPAKPAAPATASTTPPWGDDFDAQTAWDALQAARAVEKKLKAEKAALSTELTTAQAKVTEFENAGKTADELKAASDKKAADDLAAARRELWIERALRKHAVDDEFVDFLTGDDEESILAKAEKLASLGKGKSDDPAPKAEDEGKTPAGRPTSTALTPGGGGTDPEPFDVDAFVLEAR